MVITEPTTSPSKASPSDFAFLRQLVTELTNIPTKEKVTFPTESRNGVYADIEGKLAYNDDDKPYGQFHFRTRRHGLEMAHAALVTFVVHAGELKYQLDMQPCKRLRSNGHKSVVTLHLTAQETALAVCHAYRPGTVTRKVILLPVEKESA